jgi:uncharacterized protein YndB with AHSA1/START domain
LRPLATVASRTDRKEASMLTAESEIVIDRSVDDVFEFMTDIHKVPMWMTSVIESRQSPPGRIGVGTEYEHTVKFLGKRFTTRARTAECVPPRRLVFVTMDRRFEMEATVTLEPQGSRTRVREIVRGDARGFFKVAEPVLVRAVQRHLDGSFAELKDLVESREVAARA